MSYGPQSIHRSDSHAAQTPQRVSRDERGRQHVPVPAPVPAPARWRPGRNVAPAMVGVDLLALQRIVGNRAVQRLLPAPHAAPAAPSLLIQCERSTIPALIGQNAPTISYQHVDEFYRNHMKPQIDEFWADVDNEDDIGDNITNWTDHYTERMAALWSEIETITPPVPDVYTYAIPLPNVIGRNPGIPSRMWSVFVTINNIRNTLNNSLTHHPRQRQEAEAKYEEDDTVGVPTMTAEEGDEKKPMIVYRQMGIEEATKILDAYGTRTSASRHASHPVLGKLNDDSSKRWWTTTTTEHSKKFVNEGDVDHETKDKLVLRFEFDRKEYNKIHKQSLPAYQTRAYDTTQSLIHQEKLVKSNRAATKSQEQLDFIASRREHYNIGFSFQDMQTLDKALKSVQPM